MSTLLLDLGNTRWKAALGNGGDIGPVLSGDYADFDNLHDGLPRGAAGVARVLIASVVDAERTAALQRRLAATVQAPVRRVLATDPMPNVRSGYRKPEQLGVDRLLAMVAARACTTAPFCVIDSGTAVTLDFVDAGGDHQGGFILPGIRLFRDCLLSNTSIPRDSAIHAADTLGRDTPTAVALGARYAVAGIVERFLIGQQRLFGDQATEVFVGGGDAQQYLALLPSPCTKIDNLVLRGLAVIAASGEA